MPPSGAFLRGSPRRVLNAAGILPSCSFSQNKRMLYTIAVVLIILWLLGLVSSYTMGGIIHILLVIAIVIVLVNFISGRKRG